MIHHFSCYRYRVTTKWITSIPIDIVDDCIVYRRSLLNFIIITSSANTTTIMQHHPHLEIVHHPIWFSFRILKAWFLTSFLRPDSPNAIYHDNTRPTVRELCQKSIVSLTSNEYGVSAVARHLRNGGLTRRRHRRWRWYSIFVIRYNGNCKRIVSSKYLLP